MKHDKIYFIFSSIFLHENMRYEISQPFTKWLGLVEDATFSHNLQWGYLWMGEKSSPLFNNFHTVVFTFHLPRI